MQEIVKKHWEYTLSQDDEGAYVFSVVSGSIGIYSLDIKLNRIETSEYVKKGVAYLDDLAEYIRDHPDEFKDRTI